MRHSSKRFFTRARGPSHTTTPFGQLWRPTHPCHKHMQELRLCHVARMRGSVALVSWCTGVALVHEVGGCLLPRSAQRLNYFVRYLAIVTSINGRCGRERGRPQWCDSVKRFSGQVPLWEVQINADKKKLIQAAGVPASFEVWLIFQYRRKRLRSTSSTSRYVSRSQCRRRA